MSSTPKGQGNSVTLGECLYWHCECGHCNYTHWIPEELSDKHCDRIRRRGRGVGQTVWHLRTPKHVVCVQCGKRFRTTPFVAE